MQPDSQVGIPTRPLTDDERKLARWMLEHGNAEARSFLDQLDRAEATLYKCDCGCPTFHFKIVDLPEAPPGVHVLADFIYGDETDPKGAFIYQSCGILSSCEFFGYNGNAPTSLPDVAELRVVPSRTPASKIIARRTAD